MSHRTIGITAAVRGYLLRLGTRESAAASALRAETLATTPWHPMQIAPEQGAFLALLVRLIGAKRTLDVGTFTGYSALVVAEALPPDGKVIACDVSEEWTAIGRPFWECAGVAGKIDLRLAPAVETLDALLAEGGARSIDFAFIDADKVEYDAYYERCLELLRPGGVIGIDNVLWGGRVADFAVDEADVPAVRLLNGLARARTGVPLSPIENARAIRALNAKVHGDTRVDMAMLPVGDGMTLAVKRG